MYLWLKEKNWSSCYWNLCVIIFPTPLAPSFHSHIYWRETSVSWRNFLVFSGQVLVWHLCSVLKMRKGKQNQTKQKEPHILKQSSEGDTAEIPACKQRQKVLCWMKWQDERGGLRANVSARGRKTIGVLAPFHPAKQHRAQKLSV